MNKLPKMYYGYKRLKSFWERMPDSHPHKKMYIDCLNESLTEIVQQYMIEFESELYNE